MFGLHVGQLAHAHAMFAGHRAAQAQRAVGHPVRQALARLRSRRVRSGRSAGWRGNCRRPHGPGSGRGCRSAAMSACVSSTASASCEIGTQMSVTSAAQPGREREHRRNRRCAACVQSAVRSSGRADQWKPRRHDRPRSRRTVSASSATACGGAVEFHQQVRRLGHVGAGIGVEGARRVAASTNSIRAMGMPIWIVSITAATAASMVGKAQTRGATSPRAGRAGAASVR